MSITLIFARSMNGCIGNQNGLPWHIKEDLQFFKKTTEGKTILMGRKTWESLPQKPLPNRLNLVLSRKIYDQIPGRLVCRDTKEVSSLVEFNEELFVIGGQTLYEQYFEKANRILMTRIDANYEGDCYFNPDLSSWKRKKLEVLRGSEPPFVTVWEYLR